MIEFDLNDKILLHPTENGWEAIEQALIESDDWKLNKDDLRKYIRERVTAGHGFKIEINDLIKYFSFLILYTGSYLMPDNKFYLLTSGSGDEINDFNKSNEHYEYRIKGAELWNKVEKQLEDWRNTKEHDKIDSGNNDNNDCRVKGAEYMNQSTAQEIKGFTDKTTIDLNNNNIDLAYFTGVFNAGGIKALTKELSRLNALNINPYDILEQNIREGVKIF